MVDFCIGRHWCGCDCVFDGGFSECAGGAGESGQEFKERINDLGFVKAGALKIVDTRPEPRASRGVGATLAVALARS